MQTNIEVHLDSADRIMLRRNLGKSQKAQRFFTHEIRRLADPYVPMRSGVLKNTAVEKVDSIHYVQVYARRQYYENKGSKNGLRGRKWIPRMWADHSQNIIRSVAKYVGGTAR